MINFTCREFRVSIFFQLFGVNLRWWCRRRSWERRRTWGGGGGEVGADVGSVGQLQVGVVEQPCYFLGGSGRTESIFMGGSEMSR